MVLYDSHTVLSRRFYDVSKILEKASKLAFAKVSDLRTWGKFWKRMMQWPSPNIFSVRFEGPVDNPY